MYARWLLSQVKSVYHLIKHYLFSRPDITSLEKKERLFQTYLIIFGLFLTFNGIPELQLWLMRLFLAFMIVALIYYITITHFHRFAPRVFINILALMMGLVFSIAFNLCIGYLSTSPGSVPFIDSEIRVLFWFFFFAILIALSLFV